MEDQYQYQGIDVGDLEKRAVPLRRIARLIWIALGIGFFLVATKIVVVVEHDCWSSVVFFSFLGIGILCYVMLPKIGVKNAGSLEWHVIKFLGMYYAKKDQGPYFLLAGLMKAYRVPKNEVPIPVFLKGEDIELIDNTTIKVDMGCTFIVEDPIKWVFSFKETMPGERMSFVRKNYQAGIQGFFTNSKIKSDPGEVQHDPESDAKKVQNKNIAPEVRQFTKETFEKWGIRVATANVGDIKLSAKTQEKMDELYSISRDIDITKMKGMIEEKKLKVFELQGAQEGLKLRAEVRLLAIQLAGLDHKEEKDLTAEDRKLIAQRMDDAWDRTLAIRGTEAIKPTDKTIITGGGGKVGEEVSGSIGREAFRETLTPPPSSFS